MELPESLKKFFNKNRNYLKIGAYGLSGLLLTGALYYFSSGIKSQLQASLVAAEAPRELGAFPVTVPTIKYGFALDTFQVFERTVQSGQVLGDILTQQKVDYPSIQKLVDNSAGVFDVRQFRVGKPYTILAKDSLQTADYLVYEPNVYEYLVFHLKGEMEVERVEREVATEVKTAAGTLETSLWNAIVGQGLTYDLADKMEDALQWSIDFHHLQNGDEFKLVYDQKYIEGEPVGIGKVHAAYYKTGNTEYNAIYYDNGKESGYYDLEGRPMKRGFLKAPVKFSRISSYYNLNRFHPILKRVRPHFGTDYAAPYGTPIYAVGDGVVEKASYTNGNGNFVKIRHDGTYQTQYLHMQKFGPGIHTGVHVKQGQVIGYVGSTGLATGPHVCFRFWKNGQQVNHLNLKFPPAKPLPDADMPAFTALRDQYIKQMGAARPAKISEEEQGSEGQKGNP
ncbi:MAG: peptidoglycan DD-metalloendopeptidase family protein [Phaeodactylibacter sp.]|nr:peptidoglycan DD-metalloendopeptidase family protein [Phaeodactylibacter sp.]